MSCHCLLAASTLTVGLGPVLLTDQLNWSVPPGTDQSNWPCSELSWHALHAIGLELCANYSTRAELQLYGTINWARYLHGSCIDRDWLGPYKSFEYSRSSCAVSGYSVSGKFSIAYPVSLELCTLSPTLSITGTSYALHQSDLKQIFIINMQPLSDSTLWQCTDQRIDATIHYCPPWDCPGALADYTITCLGPWAAVELQSPLTSKTTLQLATALGVAQLWGSADWLKRDCFKHPQSFTHSGLLWGAEAQLAIRQSLSHRCHLSAALLYRNMSMLHVHESVYWVDGFVETAPLCSFRLQRMQFNLCLSCYF